MALSYFQDHHHSRDEELTMYAGDVTSPSSTSIFTTRVYEVRREGNIYSLFVCSPRGGERGSPYPGLVYPSTPKGRMVVRCRRYASCVHRGLIFPVFAFCVLRLCLAFRILLGANIAANVGRTQEVPRNVRHK